MISRHGANGLRRLTSFACVGLGTVLVGCGWYLLLELVLKIGFKPS